MGTPDEISEAAAILREAEGILFITGAGLSVDSGLPTYRGTGGLYEGRDTGDGIAIEDALSGEMLRTRPEVTWKYFWEIAEATRGGKPNHGHEIVASVEAAKPSTWVLTQNVDGLHYDAGSRNLIEIHGRAGNLSCTSCDRSYPGEELLYGGELKAPQVPYCSDCGGLIRPDVVLFGETLDENDVARLESLADCGIEAVVSVGTSSQFSYITAPMEFAVGVGIPTIEINVEETVASDWARIRLRMSCTAGLRALWERMQ